jgi:hypothetical protein
MTEIAGNETRIVYIINPYKLAINKNLITDIEVGDEFEIYELTEEIVDPKSSESLGRLKIYKGSGKAEEVQDTMAIISSTRVDLQSFFSVSKPLHDQFYLPFNDPKIGDVAVRRVSVKENAKKAIEAKAEYSSKEGE